MPHDLLLGDALALASLTPPATRKAALDAAVQHTMWTLQPSVASEK